MKITILTYGTRGDVQPFMALAVRLQLRGHAVRLAAPHRYADFVARHGVPFIPLAGDPEEMSASLNRAASNPVSAARTMRHYGYALADEIVPVALEACEGADMVVHGLAFTMGGHYAAQARGLPDVSVQAIPVFAPTRAFPHVLLPTIPPGPLSLFTHMLGERIFRMLHQGLRLPDGSRPRLAWPFDPSAAERTPLLLAYSRTVLPPPADWTDPYVHVTGYLFLDAGPEYQPPAELSEFLASGEPPVCVTFGSMVNRESGSIQRRVRAALKAAGRRAIILTGWEGSRDAQPEPDILQLEAAPHDWLLPRCWAVIHHGGAGTTAAGLRAGIPNIIIPHAVDQRFWARRVASLGAGPAPLPLKRFTSASLAAALEQAEGPVMRAQAQKVGRQIRAEDGLGEAVRLIEAAGAG